MKEARFLHASHTGELKNLYVYFYIIFKLC